MHTLTQAETATLTPIEQLSERLRAELSALDGNICADNYDVIRARADHDGERIAIHSANLYENAVRAETFQRVLAWLGEIERPAAVATEALAIAG